MKKLTIFTPTYNRAYCLSNCYESLKRQTNMDFVWLIIDDGSTDETEKLIFKWMEERVIEILYIQQENQGMHGAHNTAYEVIETELNVCIDSDDFMPDDAVDKILTCWDKYGSNEVSGIIGLDAYTDGSIIGTRLPKGLKQSTLFQLYQKHRVTGDKKVVYRTELTRDFPYPLYENEKYVGLAYKYYKLDQYFEMILLDEVLCYVEYLEDGSSYNMFNQYRRNPRGFAFYRRELMKLPFANYLFKFRQAIHYVSSSMMGKNLNYLREAPSRVMTLSATPFGIVLYFYIMFKTRHVKTIT
ncbi:glycosyltransferase family 2 protein [Pseudalkalibacillus hwajinpoensis]|uniref:glycosyltransferase family 2 protein n=1 Tax=Guptibacillus hwajinpoensis TaxID=208199 RepID=UPI001CFC6D65|nr:glycosyltransferase family 2 protein [Pseudalkalibacillus hwajinpoensis]